MANYGLIRDPGDEVEVPTGGILSRTVHEDDRVTLTVFAFDAGQELTEHTSSRAAIIEVLEGEAEIDLDGETVDAGPGTWISMPPGMRHALRARTPLKMALTLLLPPA
jgi:quercetin dioxygenase-like cupin family protein